MRPKMIILKNKRIEVHVSTLGAMITRLFTLDRKGEPVDVVLGMEQADDYLTPEYVASGAYLGACIGRYANRIAKGRFLIDGQAYQLAINNGENHLHGGVCGFSQKKWEVVEHQSDKLTLHYQSPDGEENYPGTLTVFVSFELKGKELWISYKASVDRKCYVNLTHHPYFNLNPSAVDIKEHQLKLYAKGYLQTNDLIPTGELIAVADEYDFTRFRSLRGVIEQHGGLDDCFVFDHSGQIIRQAELFCEETGITLYVCSDYPGLQVYTGRYLNVKAAKQGKNYGAYAGIALEAQFWPDSPNHPTFPVTLLLPGHEYAHTTIYGFE